METAKLFYKDSFTKEFQAKVVSCEAWEEGYRVVLDQTGFFRKEADRLQTQVIWWQELEKDRKSECPMYRKKVALFII